jgi:protein-S-isoprenylcysteine O-methyltransferase Ste14
MRASTIEFRLRMLINAVIVVLGLWAPWIGAWGIGRRTTLLEWLALELSRTRLLSFTLATPLVIVLAALLAAVGMVLRIWGSAYLSPTTVINPEMLAQGVMADGPYRYVRNPLYLGLWFMIAAMSFIMPVTGALVAMILLTFFLMRLILGEEAFLAARLGEPYQAYLGSVPRLVPRLGTTLSPSGSRPRWGLAALSELTPIGVFFTLAVLSWRYDNELMLRAILISFGLSLVVRAFVPGIRREKDLVA